MAYKKSIGTKMNDDLCLEVVQGHVIGMRAQITSVSNIIGRVFMSAKDNKQT